MLVIAARDIRVERI